ncbi:hypothetical protein TSUD_418700, partial [Trifolium subterraneum]
MDMDRFKCVLHYGECFGNKENLEYVGKETSWSCVSDKWSYWELTSILEDKGVKPSHIIGMCYHDPTHNLRLGFREIKDDRGAMKMIEIAQTHGSVVVYVDNGSNYVIGPPKNQEEIGDNGHYELVKQSNSIVVYAGNENDVHSEIFGDHYDIDTDSDMEVMSEDSDREDRSEEESIDEYEEEGGEDDFFVQARESPLEVAKQNNGDSTSVVQMKDKKKRGRPRRVDSKEVVHENINEESSDGSLYDERAVAKEVRQIRENRGLSDVDSYSELLENGGETDEEDDVMSAAKFPTFKLPKTMEDYKWEEGTYFISKQSFRQAIITYSVHSGRDCKIYKNDKKRMRVRCKPECPWNAYCYKLPHEDTWQ